MFSIQRSTITIETARKYICRPSIPSQKKHPMNSIQLQILFWELNKISKEIVNKSRVHCSYTIYYIIPKYLCILIILCTYLNLESSLLNNNSQKMARKIAGQGSLSLKLSKSQAVIEGRPIYPLIFRFYTTMQHNSAVSGSVLNE